MGTTTKTVGAVTAAVLLAVAGAAMSGSGGEDGEALVAPVCRAVSLHLDCDSVKALPGGDGYACAEGEMVGVAAEARIEDLPEWGTDLAAITGTLDGEGVFAVVHGTSARAIPCDEWPHGDDAVVLVPPETHPEHCLIGEVRDAGHPATDEWEGTPAREFVGRCCGSTCSPQDGGATAYAIMYEMAGHETWRGVLCRVVPGADGCER